MEQHAQARWDTWDQRDQTRWDDWSDREQQEKDCWTKMEESIDLLFAKVGEIDKTQQQVVTQLDLSAQVMEQILMDQTLLSKQMETTGKAVA
jgi:hypothetical protein